MVFQSLQHLETKTMEIHGYPKWQRIYTACIFVVVGLFFLWLYWTNPSSKGSWFGLILTALNFWLAIYWICLPKVLGVLTPVGMDYINQELGFFFCYRWFHIDWHKVTLIRTVEKTGKGGPFLETILRAVDTEDPGKTHSFRINSSNMDYYRFLAYTKAVVDPAALTRDSLPLDPTLLSRKVRGDLRNQVVVLFITVLVLAAVLFFAYFIRK
jgi:hypothetical protein